MSRRFVFLLVLAIVLSCCQDCSAAKPGRCPAVRPGSSGVCAMLCQNDYSCGGNNKCCRNGCGGTSCVRPV